jgi:hypothetical protein
VNRQFVRESTGPKKALVNTSQRVKREPPQATLLALVMTPMTKVRDHQSVLLRIVVSLKSQRVLEGNKAGTVHQGLLAPKDLKVQEVIRGCRVDQVNVVLLVIEGCPEIRVLLEEAVEPQNRESLNPQPYFKEDVRASEFPKFDGSAKAFDLWLAKGNYFYMYGYGTKLADTLGRVATFNFKGLAVTWWAGLPQDE